MSQNQSVETVAEYVARGGKITVAKPARAKGAQKPQKMKRAWR